MDMVERVARAICEAQTQGEEMWAAFQPEAIAAIKAMREPTEVMAGVGDLYIDNPHLLSRDVWQAMINTALEEQD